MRVLSVSFIILIADQVSKLFVKGFSIPFLNINYEGFIYGERVKIIGDIFSFTFVENPGIAFGINFGSHFKLLLSIFTIIACTGLFIYLFKIRNKPLNLRLAIAVILGGALGNLIDRVFYGIFYGYAPFLKGKVVDFLDFRILNLIFDQHNFSNYIFNIADVAVTVGMVLLIFSFRWNESEDTSRALQTVTVENNLSENN